MRDHSVSPKRAAGSRPLVSRWERLAAIAWIAAISPIAFWAALYAVIRGDMWGGGPGVDAQRIFLVAGIIEYAALAALLVYIFR